MTVNKLIVHLQGLAWSGYGDSRVCLTTPAGLRPVEGKPVAVEIGLEGGLEATHVIDLTGGAL